MAKRLKEKYATAKGVDTVEGVAFVIGAEAGNVINVGLTYKDADNKTIPVRAGCFAYFCDDANGDTPQAVAFSGAVAIGANGVLIDPAATKKSFWLISEVTGLIDINITEAGVKTSRLVVVLPDGALVVSPAITFA